MCKAGKSKLHQIGYQWRHEAILWITHITAYRNNSEIVPHLLHGAGIFTYMTG